MSHQSSKIDIAVSGWAALAVLCCLPSPAQTVVKQASRIDVVGGIAKLHVADARPLPAALFRLSELLGVQVGFEEARLQYPGDLVNLRLSGSVPPFYVPRGGPLDIDFPVSAATGLAIDPADVIKRLLVEYHTQKYPGRYSFISQGGSGGYILVFPESAANEKGEFEKLEPITRARITVRYRDGQNFTRVLSDALAGISEVSGKSLAYGDVPISKNEIKTWNLHLEAVDEPAFVFLNRIGSTTGHSFWRIVYDPWEKNYWIAFRH